MQDFIDYLSNNIDDTGQFALKIVTTVIAIALLWGIQTGISYLLHEYAEKEKVIRRVSRTSRTILTLIGLIIIFWLWFSSFRGLGILFAVLAFVIFLSLQDIILDVTYYFYVKIKKPFQEGDILEIDGVVGKVSDIDFLQIQLEEMGNILHNLQPTGRLFTVPNRALINEKVFNYSFENNYILQDINILVSFDTDMENAMKITGRIAYEHFQNMSENYDETELKHFKRQLEYNNYDIKPQIWYEIDPNGYRIYILFFTHIEEIAKTRRILHNNLYEGLSAAKIDMPNPIYTRYETTGEG